jgi:demethylspheroidene O-methyltransferase
MHPRAATPLAEAGVVAAPNAAASAGVTADRGAAPADRSRLLSTVDRLLGWRDRLLASPRFQRWASAFPLTRPIALRRASRLFDLCAGFVYTQTLLSCLRLGLFDLLANGPLQPADIADRTGLSLDAANRLLEAAGALDLVERRSGGRWGLGILGAPVVGNAAVAAMIEHNALFYDDLADPVAVLRGRSPPTRLAEYWPYAGQGTAPGGGAAERYSTLMASSVSLVAEELLDAYPLHRHRHLLDVGGGEGAFVETAAERHPHLRFTLFDLPTVALRAHDRLNLAGLASRVATVAGDFRADTLPLGADVVTLLRILHDHDDPAALALLRAVHRALPSGGTLLIAEPLAGLRGAERVGAAYFALYFLAMGSGRPRTPDQYRRLLRQAGFRDSRLLRPRRPVQAAVIVATA